MAKLTKAQRDRLPETDFGEPARRLFPITDNDDIRAAARLLAKADDPDAVKQRIVDIADRKGLEVPEEWRQTAGAFAAFSADDGEFGILFDLDAEFAEDDATHIVRECPVLFHAGSYEFRDAPPYEMTPEEIMAACADFAEPVPLSDTHATKGASVFDGQLGEVFELNPTADFSSVGVKARIPRWLHTLFQGQPIPLSAHWDRATKRLSKVALVKNPRITEAALFAAFAGDQMAKGGRDMTPHGQALLQHVHDMTAQHGAVCSSGDKSAAEFTAEHESDTIQKLHDLTLGSGAQCAIYRENLGKSRKEMTGNYYDTTVDLRPMYRRYQPGSYATMSTEEEAAVTTPPPAPAKPANPPARPAPPRAPVRPDPETQRLRQENQELRRRTVAAEAATFAQEVKADCRCLPYQVPGLLAEYQQAALDDAALGGVATFSDEQGETVQGSRVDAVVARWRAMPQHQFTEETVADATFTVTGNEAVTRTGRDLDLAGAQQSAERHAEKRNQNLRNGQKRH